MTSIRRYTVEWTGFQGGPGVSTFYSTDTDGMAAALQNFFTAVADRIADAVTFQVNNTGLVINDLNGEAIGNYTDGAAQPAILASALGPVAAPAGAHVNWTTSSFVAGKRVRGRTFLVPLVGFESDGTISSVVLDDLQAAADALVLAGALFFVIWARPFPGNPVPVPPIPARDGSSHLVSGNNVPDKVAVLTSRRD